MQVYITKVYMFGSEIVGYQVEFGDTISCSVFRDSLIKYLSSNDYIFINFSLIEESIEIVTDVPVEYISEPSVLKDFHDILGLAGFLKY